MGVCGCMSENKTNKAEEMKKIALEYLNSNYNDSFTAIGYSDGDWAYDYSTVNFTSQNYNDTVEVKIYDENGTYSFKDDYFKLVMKDEAETLFASISLKYGYSSEIKVRFISSELPEALANNATFSDYIETGKCNLEVYFISNSTFDESSINSILTDICNKKVMGNIRFVVTDDEGLLDQYSISEIVNEKAESVLQKQSYSINSNFEVVE